MRQTRGRDPAPLGSRGHPVGCSGLHRGPGAAQRHGHPAGGQGPGDVSGGVARPIDQLPPLGRCRPGGGRRRHGARGPRATGRCDRCGAGHRHDARRGQRPAPAVAPARPRPPGPPRAPPSPRSSRRSGARRAPGPPGRPTPPPRHHRLGPRRARRVRVGRASSVDPNAEPRRQGPAGVRCGIGPGGCAHLDRDAVAPVGGRCPRPSGPAGGGRLTCADRAPASHRGARCWRCWAQRSPSRWVGSR